MKTNITTVDEYTSVSEAKQLMEDSAIGSLPVVKNKKLVGLITRNDFII